VTTIQSTEISGEDRLIATLAHASTLINVVLPVVGGPGLCLTLWIIFRERKWVAFQTLQALAFQIVSGVFGAVVMTCGFAAALGAIPFGFNDSSTGVMWGISAIGYFFVCGGLIVYFLPIIFGIVGAVRTYRGQEFLYPWVGKRISNMLANRTNTK
jgi:uncharacterized Tic20 family protein